jgi:hypothetical protein
MAVRSNYIKKLMESKNSLEKQYQEVIAESMKNIIGENAKEEVRKLLKEAEDEDSFSEEDVEDDTAATTDKEKVADTDADNASDDTDADATADVDGGEDGETVDVDADNTESGEEGAGEDLWNDLEGCKSADGEYDCRGMEDGKLLKVLKAMGPEDGIRVMSNGDGTVEVEVDGDLIDGQQEFVIDVDDFSGDEGLEDGDEDLEDGDEIEFELDESANLGYGPKQNDTAMTTDPDETLPTDRKKVGHTWNPDLKNSTSDVRKTGDGDRQPFDNDVNEGVDECDTVYEVEQDDDDMIDEVMTSTENSGAARGVSNTHINTNSSHKFARNGHVEAQSPTNMADGRGTGDGYKEATNESVNLRKMVNKLYEENKQMKSIVPELTKKLNESMVINASMGYIVRLLNENSTSQEEKKQISERFTKVNSLEEGKKLYETISAELKNVGRTNNVKGIINSQLAEGKQNKQNLVETTMYKSEEVNKTLDFMKRLNAVK